MSKHDEKVMLSLLKAVANENFDAVVHWLKFGTGIDFYFSSDKDKNLHGLSPLTAAAKYNNRSDILELLIKKADKITINWVNPFGSTALLYAAEKGNKNMVALLLANGAEPNINENWGGTALHWAARNGHKNIVHMLLKYGADPRLKSTKDETASEAARNNGHENIATLLEHAENKWQKINDDTILHRQLLTPDMGLTSIFNFSSMSVTKIFKHFDIKQTRQTELSFTDDKVSANDIMKAKKNFVRNGGKLDINKLKYILLRKKRAIASNNTRVIKTKNTSIGKN